MTDSNDTTGADTGGCAPVENAAPGSIRGGAHAILSTILPSLRAEYAAALRSLDEINGNPGMTISMPRSGQLIAHAVDAAALRGRLAHAHMDPRSFYNLREGTGGRRVLQPLLEELTRIIVGPHGATPDIDYASFEPQMRADLIQSCERYDALAAVLSLSGLPVDQAARVILRVILPDLAIRRAALLHMAGQTSVSPAPITDPKPFRALLRLILRESGMQRKEIVKTSPDDPDGIVPRTLAWWEAGKTLPSDRQLAHLAKAIVARTRIKDGAPRWTEKLVRGWLRSGRAAQYLRGKLEDALSPEAVADLLSGLDELTTIAFERLGSDEVVPALVVSIEHFIDREHVFESFEHLARWWRPTRTSLEQLRAAGVTDPVALAHGVASYALTHPDPEVRLAARVLFHGAALMGALAGGASGVLGPWLCESMARRVGSPSVADTLRRLCLRDWREAALDIAAMLAVLDAVAAGDPGARANIAGAVEHLLGFAPASAPRQETLNPRRSEDTMSKNGGGKGGGGKGGSGKGGSGGKGGGGKGGSGGRGASNPNWPSKTGRESGGGRGNNPPRPKRRPNG